VSELLLSRVVKVGGGGEKGKKGSKFRREGGIKKDVKRSKREFRSWHRRLRAELNRQLVQIFVFRGFY